MLLQGCYPPFPGPLLHTAEPGGEEFAEYIRSMAERQAATPAEAWAALTCLQYATTNQQKVCCMVAGVPISHSQNPSSQSAQDLRACESVAACPHYTDLFFRQSRFSS